MSGLFRSFALVLALAGAVALGGCGDETNSRDAKNAYVREVNAAQAQFAATVTSVSQEITPKSSPNQDRRTLERFETAIGDVVERLHGIDAPSDVQAEHKQLIAAMTGFGTEIEKATAALRNPSTRSIAEAIAAINSKLRDA
jgi:hypothetical protein